MARLVTKYAAALGLAGALTLKHLRTFEPHQPGMGEIEGDCKTQHAVGCKEFLRQPHVQPGHELRAASSR